MKARKFVSTLMAGVIALGCAVIPAPQVQAQEVQDVELQTQWTLEKGYEYIEYLESILRTAGVDPESVVTLSEAEVVSDAFVGTVQLKVVDEKGNGIPAKVKFYPVSSSQTAAKYNKTNNKIDGITAFATIGGDSYGGLGAGELAYFKKDKEPNKNDADTISEEGTWIKGLEVPCGKFFGKPAAQKYIVEISKGSEYEIIRKEVSVKQGQMSDMGTVVLRRIVDMSEEGWYGGDIHHHSIYSSAMIAPDGTNNDQVDQSGTDAAFDTIEEVLASMMAAGMDFGALSEHHNVVNHNKWLAVKQTGFEPIVGKEISSSNGHIQVLGTSKNITYRIPGEHIDVERTDAYLKSEFLRVIEEVKAAGGYVGINHPRDLSSSNAFPLEFTDIIDEFQWIEVWNGSNNMLKGTTNYEAFKLWTGLLNEGRFVPAVTGSDTHNIYEDDYNSLLSTLMSLVDAIRLIQGTFTGELKVTVETILRIYDNIMPKVEMWVEENLGSGGVKTYVYLGDKAPTVTNVLDAVVAGHAVMSNGPIVTASITDSVDETAKISGETVRVDKNAVDIDVKVVSNRPVTYVYVLAQGKEIKKIPVTAKENGKGGYECEVNIKDLEVEKLVGKETSWISIVAASDVSNIAITNPILIREEETLGLSSLNVDAGALSTDFDTDVTEYGVKVKHATEAITLTAEAAGEEVVMTINGEEVTSGEGYTMPLEEGKNTATIIVKDYTEAEKTYRVEIERLGAIAYNQGSMVIDQAEAQLTETFTLPVQLEDMNNLGRLYAEVEYDATQLQLEGITLDGFDFHAANTSVPGKIIIDALSQEGINTVYAEAVAYITFSVREDAVEGETSVNISHSMANGADIEAAEITLKIQEGMVRIAGSIFGDLNQDDVVNQADIHMILQHLVSKVSLGESLKKADINKDGNVDSADALALLVKINK